MTVLLQHLIVHDIVSVHRIRLTQIRLYANETVRVRIVQGYLDQQDRLEFEEYDVLYCSTSDGPG